MADERVDDVLDGAANIATTSIHKSGDIVAGADEVLHGDVSGGVGHIIQAAGDIATNAAEQGIQIAKDLVGGSGDEGSAEDEAPAGDDAP